MAKETTIAREGNVNPLNAKRGNRREVLPFDAAGTSSKKLRFYKELAMKDFDNFIARNGWSRDYYNLTKERVDSIDKELKRRGEL